jgi:myosin heavy subunit
LALLDEESRFPEATDESLLLKLHKNHESQDYYEKPKQKGNNFIVKHYAGNVCSLFSLFWVYNSSATHSR